MMGHEFAQKDLIAKATAWLEKIAKELAEGVLRSLMQVAVEMEPHASNDPSAPNYDATATIDDGTCETPAVWETSTSMASSAWPTS